MAAPRVSIVGEEESPSLVFALTSQARDLEELQAWSRETLARPFRDLRRVGRVKVSGGGTREMVVFASQRRLAGLGLSAADVMRALSAQAVGGRHPVSLTSLTELETFALPLPNGDRVPLAEVAQIAEHEAQNPSRALFEGQPAIHLEIHPQRVADAAEAGNPGRHSLPGCAPMARCRTISGSSPCSTAPAIAGARAHIATGRRRSRGGRAHVVTGAVFPDATRADH